MVEQWEKTSLLHQTSNAFRMKLAFLFLATLAFLGLTGCGPKTDRLEVSGEITLDGTPLDSGSIRFTSQGAEKLMSSGAVIQDGEFRIPREKGLLTGSYLVEITSPDHNSMVKVRVKPDKPPIPLPAERIPSHYNKDSQETVDVSSDSENHFVYHIES